MNYVVSYTSCPIANEKKPLDSCLPSWDLLPVVNRVIYPIGNLESALHPIDIIECLGMCPIWDGLLPLYEFFLEFIIQFDLVLDVD